MPDSITTRVEHYSLCVSTDPSLGAYQFLISRSASNLLFALPISFISAYVFHVPSSVRLVEAISNFHGR
jgi:hypothetical protein